MRVLQINKSDDIQFSAPARSNGTQVVNGSGKSLNFATPDDLLSGVRDKLGGDVCATLKDEELEFCIASLSAIWNVLNQHIASQSPDQTGAGQKLNSKNHDFMERLKQVLESLHTDPDLGLEQMADRMAISGRQLQRKLKSIADQQPVEYLRCFRLGIAREQLKTGQQVGLVAEAVGFSSSAYFTSCFKAHFGLTPSEFQQQPR
jgi:transcriptional regulator GlxA family with amidase domain